MSTTSQNIVRNDQGVAVDDASINHENNEVFGGTSASDISRGGPEAGPATPRTTPVTFNDSGFDGSEGLITPEQPYKDFILYDNVSHHHFGTRSADTGSWVADNHGFSHGEDEISLEMKDIGSYYGVRTYGAGCEQATENLQEAYQQLATDVDGIYEVADNSDAYFFYDHTSVESSFNNSITTWASTSHRHESLMYRTEHPTHPAHDFQVPQPLKNQRRAGRVSRTL